VQTALCNKRNESSRTRASTWRFQVTQQEVQKFHFAVDDLAENFNTYVRCGRHFKQEYCAGKD